MNHNDYLTFSSYHAESCGIPDDISNRIREACSGNGDLMFLAPAEPKFDLFAEDNYVNYMLHLGDPRKEPDYPTLRKFLEDKGYSPDDGGSLRKYLIEWKGHDIKADGPFEPVIDTIVANLDKPITDSEQDDWLENDFQETLPGAYDYLTALPLDDGEPLGEVSLGCVSFVEGDRPGSDLTYVEIDSLAAVLALQHRLNELKTGARIVLA